MFYRNLSAKVIGCRSAQFAPFVFWATISSIFASKVQGGSDKNSDVSSFGVLVS